MQNSKIPQKFSFNIAIVGGGRACKFFLELLQTDYLKYLDINLLGVCDINPEADGMKLARKMGIPTTDNFKEFFELENLDSIIELTNSREVLLDLTRLRPKGVGIMEHNLGRLFRSFYNMDQRVKSAEYQANLQKMFSDFLIQESDAAIVVLNTDFTIQEANEPYLKIVGKTRQQVLGAYCYEVYYGLDTPCSSSRPIMRCPMLEACRSGRSAHAVHEFYGSKGRTSYGNIVTYPLKNQDGEVFQVIEVIRDITETISNGWEKRIKELKADLNKMVQEDRMISLGKLVASCVHEINNPIQGLLTFSDLMARILARGDPQPEDLEQFQHFLSIMSKELERCGSIVSGLLSFSREIPLEYKSIDLNEVLDAVITLTRHKMELQNIRLVRNTHSGTLVVKGDNNRLQQTFLNLLFNAIEAMPEGGRLEITSLLNREKREALVEIKDTGCGIRKEYIDHIYDPFFTTKKEGEGTGLGLSIVYGVVNNHRGKIAVESTEGKGTVFTLRLPLLE
ncbi:MAG: PAS domain-containing protein [Deltaproteobacteria bacterium]|nr:PAS domain-containing protein [Deltaproteobacteria bacterium]